jgi:hypothetical protein
MIFKKQKRYGKCSVLEMVRVVASIVI